MHVKVLDEFKRLAEKRLNDLEQTEQSDSGLHALHCMKTVAALQEIHHYLHDLVELLNELKPDIRMDMDLGVLGQLAQLQQTDYRLFAESTHRREVLRLVFTLQNDTILEYEASDDPAIQKQLDMCKRQGLIVSYISRTPVKISVQGYIPVAVEFYSDFAGSSIHVVIQNFLKISDTHYLLSSDNINEDTLDQLGKFLLRRDTKLLDLLVEDTQATSGAFRSGQHATASAQPQTEELEASRLKSLFNREQRLYLTYQNNIKDLGARNTRFVMGRAPDCDLMINSDLASRHHAEILYRKGKFVLIDQSTNGTFVKPQGGREVYVHSEEVPLTGSGFISLGKSVTVDNENLVYYSCQ